MQQSTNISQGLKKQGGAALIAFMCCLDLGADSSGRGHAPEIPATDSLDEIVVTARRREQSALELAGNIERLDESDLIDVQHQHIAELLTRVAGTWVVRGSGQEHLTAIRSPVLTGAGSCGGFLFLEDGIPTRPAGFCNVNQMLELDSEQARSIEVIRGPGNALFGSNALHGVINVLMPFPRSGHTPYLSLEYGANHYVRAKAAIPFDANSPWLLSAAYTYDGGFREHSDYEQMKLHGKREGRILAGDVTYAFTATYLDQNTAGFVPGKDAYKDRELSKKNFNPDAFRKASSQRFYALWNRAFKNFELDLRPFVRHSKMEFLLHFIPGTPLENNGHVSAGMISAFTFSGKGHLTSAGVDFEWADVYLDQYQEGPASGSPVQVETRPPGQHYDYEVTSFSLAPFVQSEIFLSDRWTLGAGLRLESLHYDYDNRMPGGNTRDDGSECGFGGCLYSRPGDRTDSFNNFAPKLSVTYRPNASTSLFTSLLRGFRAPQTTELYRLQNGQLVSDLDSEIIDSLEFGLRSRQDNWTADIVAFFMKKKDSVFRDAQGFNVSGARTRHQGIEASAQLQLNDHWSFHLDGTWAKHTYDFNFTPGRGEQIISGRDVDTAPGLMGSLRLRYANPRGWSGELQWVYLGEYYLEAQNRFTYSGHELLNLRIGKSLSEQLVLNFRLNNLADRAYADRADFAFGNYRYFPGRGRELFAEIRYIP